MKEGDYIKFVTNMGNDRYGVIVKMYREKAKHIAGRGGYVEMIEILLNNGSFIRVIDADWRNFRIISGG
jgi:hypothetical protein